MNSEEGINGIKDGSRLFNETVVPPPSSLSFHAFLFIFRRHAKLVYLKRHSVKRNRMNPMKEEESNDPN